MISVDKALSCIRSLDGSPGYPFHHEAEVRMAEVLSHEAESEAHAEAIIAEFDNGFPTAAQIKAAAKDLAEKCQCGVARYEHHKRGCRSFATVDEFAPSETDRNAFNDFKHNAVPMIPGVRWEVCLQIETIKINLGLRSIPPSPAEISRNERDFREAVAAIRAGREPDPQPIEAVLKKRIPGWNTGTAPNSFSKPRPTPITDAEIRAEMKRKKNQC